MRTKRARAVPASKKPKPQDAEPLQVVGNDGTVYLIPAELGYPRNPETKTYRTWIAYAVTYFQRYDAWPVWNATVGGQVSNFIGRVGEKAAPHIAAFYVRKVREQFVVNQMHSFGLLLGGAEKYATQAQTNRGMTATQAKHADQTASNASVADEAAAKALAMVNERREREGKGPLC